MNELERAYKQIDYLAQTLEITIKEKEALESQLSEAREALEDISVHVYCMGPGCYYCDGDTEHPLSHAARIAKEALAKLETPK